MKTKVCTQCKQLKPINAFYKAHNKKYYFSECKFCFKERTNENRKAKIEQYKLSKRTYVSLDPQRWAKYAKDYQKEHAERICLAIKIRFLLKRLNDVYNINVGKFSIRKKTNKELKKYHLYIKSFLKSQKTKNS
jgi:hypothetical protein